MTSPRIAAEIKPERSATPTPKRATNTVPKGVKPVKLVTRLVTIRCIPSALSKLTALITVSPSLGSTALTPK